MCHEFLYNSPERNLTKTFPSFLETLRTDRQTDGQGEANWRIIAIYDKHVLKRSLSNKTRLMVF